MTPQRGMTLVELLISMVLSLSLIAGISSLFLQMQKSNKYQRSLSSMADESSYVQEVLQKEIRRTGGLRSRSDKSGTPDKIFLTQNNVLETGINLVVGEYIKGDANSPDNDGFVIRYQLSDANDLSAVTTSNGSSPCTQKVLLDPGENPGVEEHVVSVYFYLNANNSTLSCKAQRKKVDTTTNTETCVKNCLNPNTVDLTSVDAPIDLISDVEKIKLSYGVDEDKNGAADYYTDAATVPANEWPNVISVRLSAVMKSSENYLTSSPQNYEVEGVWYTPSDQRLHKVFTTTIALRNQIL